MKISKRTREQAALYCAGVASSAWTDHLSTDLRAQHGRMAASVAGDAWRLARERLGTLPGSRTAWAEAEALLRCGWSP